jgi:hypothetical protein
MAGVPPVFHRGATVSLVKRLSLFGSLVAVLIVGMGVSGEAQIRRGRTVIVGGGFYYADPFWYGYPWFPYGYPVAPYQYPIGRYPYGYRFAEPDSAVRLDVSPKEAEVYVDCYYAGIVDNFDGVFQRLRVPPGQHELTLYHDGYRTVHQTLYLTADSTFKVHFNMEKLAAGDVAEQRPTPREAPPAIAGQAGPNQPGQPGPPAGQPRRPPVGRRAPLPLPPNQGDPRGGQASAYGTLAIRVQPGNATVTIDGERWDGPQGQDRLMVELAEGTHRVQVQRDGFEAYANDVMIRRGETTPLNVSLRTR